MHACMHTYIHIYIYIHVFYIYKHKHLYDIHFCFNQILKYVVVFLRLTIFREGSRQDVIQSGNKELLTDHLVRSGAWLCQGWRGVKLAQWIRHRFEPAWCQVGAGMVWGSPILWCKSLYFCRVYLPEVCVAFGISLSFPRMIADRMWWVWVVCHWVFFCAVFCF